MKIIQDIVINHTGNFGEATLAPMFTKEYSTLKDLESVNCMVPIPDSDFAKHSLTMTVLLRVISIRQDLI